MEGSVSKIRVASVLAGLSLGVLVYSLAVWFTSFPNVLISYWFGFTNEKLVSVIALSVLITFLFYLILSLRSEKHSKSLKVKVVIIILSIAGLSKFSLSFSQRFRESNRLDTKELREDYLDGFKHDLHR